MDRTETLKIMVVLQAVYPQFYAKKEKEEIDGIVDLWAEMFEDEPYQLVAMATKALIKTRTSTFPPGIGEINEKIRQISTPDEMTEMEAWSMVANALRNSAYNSQAEYDKLPPVVQRIVGSPGQLREWSQMDASEVGTVIASNFQRSYRERAKNEREYEALPASVKSYMQALADKMDIKRIEGGAGDGSRNPVHYQAAPDY